MTWHETQTVDIDFQTAVTGNTWQRHINMRDIHKTRDICEQWRDDWPMTRHGRITWQTTNHMTDMEHHM